MILYTMFDNQKVYDISDIATDIDIQWSQVNELTLLKNNALQISQGCLGYLEQPVECTVWALC